jgi:hypothetical protein
MRVQESFKCVSSIRLLQHLRMPPFFESHVKNEPMLFNCDYDAAMQLGGPITQFFAARCFAHCGPEDLVIDTRVHMLMPGWWPCIPGWHHDDVPRLRDDGQPWYPELEGEHSSLYRSRHLMAIVGSDASLTEFAIGEAEFPAIPPGEIGYKIWHPIVDAYVADGTLELVRAGVGEMIAFDDRSWHQGVRATGNGWRWFGRASYATDRARHVTNEVRRQVQVYLENPMEGW